MNRIPEFLEIPYISSPHTPKIMKKATKFRFPKIDFPEMISIANKVVQMEYSIDKRIKW